MKDSEAAAIAAKSIQEEIDMEVLMDLMVALSGWHRIELDRIPRTDDGTVSAMLSWCQENTTGDWKSAGFGRTWVFAHQQDAMMFSLRWS